MSSPYTLPDGQVAIAFSGGRTSGFMLHEILEANGPLPERVVVSFQNTGREMPATLDFVQEIGERWNVPIVWLEYRAKKPLFEVVSHNSASRDGEPFEALLRKKQTLPNHHQKFCSAELKTLTAKRYLVSLGWKRWTAAVGFRADEMQREPYQDNRATGWTPLRDANVSKRDVAAFWRRQPFDLRLPIVKGKTIGGNCKKCFQKSEEEIAAHIRDYPADDWPDRMEAKFGRTFSSRYSHAQLREMVERQGDWIFDTEGALCQADGGECV